MGKRGSGPGLVAPALLGLALGITAPLVLPGALQAQLVSARQLDPSEIPETVDRLEYESFQARLQAGDLPDDRESAALPEPVAALVEGMHAVLQGQLARADRTLNPLTAGDGGAGRVATALLTQLRFERRDFVGFAHLMDEEPGIVRALRAGPPERFTATPGPSSPEREAIVVGERGHLGLAARSGDWSGTFWFDTGAGLTVLSDSLAAVLGVEYASSATVPLSTSTELETEARIGVLPLLEVGGVRVENHRIAVVPVAELRMIDSEKNWRTLHAILGWTALRRIRLTLDVPAGRFEAELGGDPASDSAVAADANLTWMGYPLLHLTSGDGQRLLFGIDTGSWNTSLTPKGLRALGLEVARRDSVDVTGVGGSQRVETGFVDGVTLQITGALYTLDNVALEESSGADEVTFFRVDGVLGADVLQPSRLVLDFPSRRFELAVRATHSGSDEAPDGSIVYLVRHAETDDSATDPRDPPLSEAGRARADELAKVLADADLTSVHSTPYERTRSTARAVADRVGLEVAEYDPFDQGGVENLIDRLRSPGRHLVVGHSNTTPAFVDALGGDVVSPIGESEYDRLYLVSIDAEGGVISTLLRYGKPSASVGSARPVPASLDPAHVGETTLTYRMSFQGDSAGIGVYRTRREAEGWRLTETSTLPGFQVDAVNDVRVGADLRPEAFRATGTMFGNPVDIDVTFAHGEANGTSLFPRSQTGSSEMAIDAEIPPGTLERTSTFFLLHALPFHEASQRGQSLGFTWFDTYSGQVQRMVAVVTGEEKVTVPAGTFDTWRIELRGGSPSQVLWVARVGPRRIVKIDVVGQPWSYELARVES